MNKKLTPIAKLPTVFDESVYLCDASGKVLLSRQGSAPKIKNIFELLPESEKSFLRDNLLFYGLKPLALVDSKVGAIIIDCLLFAKYRTAVAIIPDFSIEELSRIVKSDLSYILKMSPSMKEIIGAISNEASIGTRERFIDGLLSIHPTESYMSFYGKDNAEIAVMMSDLAFSLSGFYGAALEVSVVGANDFDMANMPCMTSYIFALSACLLAAREYSANRAARLKLIFDEMGVCMELGFKLAEEYRSIELSRRSEGISHLLRSADSRLFICNAYQDEKAFVISAYPWVREPNSSDLKERKPELIYYY